MGASSEKQVGPGSYLERVHHSRRVQFPTSIPGTPDHRKRFYLLPFGTRTRFRWPFRATSRSVTVVAVASISSAGLAATFLPERIAALPPTGRLQFWRVKTGETSKQKVYKPG